ncbi:putative transcriptional regulator [Lactococcus lactis]|uniref:Transcriptional regulator n=3 Tax=Lactococcus lactis TaxID=1358 RepID=A0ABD5GLC6_9LACT|nr:putative transcriptional regulator [Lactococcus lactis]MDV2617836.1 putative transcriptional regulator [Lactococcus lactis]CDI47257.1 orf11 [Lactococcus lactis subsp. lactis Dephy 1]
MEKVVTHYGETIQQHSVEWYKKQLLKDFSVQFIKDSLLPQLFEWSNAYKAAVELTKQKAPEGRKGSLYDDFE